MLYCTQPQPPPALAIPLEGTHKQRQQVGFETKNREWCPRKNVLRNWNYLPGKHTTQSRGDHESYLCIFQVPQGRGIKSFCVVTREQKKEQQITFMRREIMLNIRKNSSGQNHQKVKQIVLGRKEFPRAGCVIADVPCWGCC